ncbi:hypothetical protein [Sulfuricurvum sp. IAE1]|nr:hypothetical protein [Sulfuricurvum sp. IAE1]
MPGHFDNLTKEEAKKQNYNRGENDEPLNCFNSGGSLPPLSFPWKVEWR